MTATEGGRLLEKCWELNLSEEKVEICMQAHHEIISLKVEFNEFKDENRIVEFLEYGIKRDEQLKRAKEIYRTINSYKKRMESELEKIKEIIGEEDFKEVFN